MRRTVILGLIFGFSLTAADLSGKWAGKAMYPDTPQTHLPGKAVELTLVQSGEQITGTFTMAGKALPLEAGTLRNGKLTFAIHAPELTTFQLSLAGERLEGRMTSAEGHLQDIGLKKQ